MMSDDTRLAEEDGLRTMVRNAVLLDLMKGRGEAGIYDRVVGMVAESARGAGASGELVTALEGEARRHVAEALEEFRRERNSEEWRADVNAALAMAGWIGGERR